MRLRFAIMMSMLCVLALPGLVAAQQAAVPPPAPPAPKAEAESAILAEIQPHAGSLAVGAAFGLYRPDEEFQVAITPEALLEFYVTGRWSIRLLVGTARPKFLDRLRSMDHVRGTANVVYNWEHQYWHPYVSLGIGLYSAQQYIVDDTRVGARYNRFGYNAAFGAEYFWRPEITVKFELNYHRVHPIWQIGDGPAGFAVTAGIKRYF